MADPITRLNAALEGRYRVERELGEGTGSTAVASGRCLGFPSLEDGCSPITTSSSSDCSQLTRSCHTGRQSQQNAGRMRMNIASARRLLERALDNMESALERA